MSTARLIKADLPDWRGVASLYRLTPPLRNHEGEPHEFVIVSATVVPVLFGGGSETYIFPADATGAVTEWLDLPGSLNHTLSHADALAAAGYAIEEA